MNLQSPSTESSIPIADQRGGLANIQALRALAAMLVVIVHLEMLGRPLGLKPVDTEMFAVGVDLFFVISGFIMVYTTSRKTLTPLKFLLNRIARIAPLYWLVTFGVFVIALAAPSVLGGTTATAPHLFKSLAFIPYVREDGLIRPMLFVGWSLNLEMLFYVIFALALLIRRVTPRIVTGAAVLVAMTVIGHVAHGGLSPVARFLTQSILLEFALGMLIGLVFRKLPTSPRIAQVAALAIPVLLLLLLFLARIPLGGWPLMSIPAGLIVVSALIAERGGLRLEQRIVKLLGDASYALYLTHPLVTQAIGKIAQKLHLLSAVTSPLLMVLVMGITIAVSVLVHVLVERPMSRAAHRLILP